MKIYKYEIPIQDTFQLILPERSKILTLQLQNNVPMLWVAITNRSTIPYDFVIYGTGHKMKEDIYHKYIGTIQLDSLVWHLFMIANIAYTIDNEDMLTKLGYF